MHDVSRQLPGQTHAEVVVLARSSKTSTSPVHRCGRSPNLATETQARPDSLRRPAAAKFVRRSSGHQAQRGGVELRGEAATIDCNTIPWVTDQRSPRHVRDSMPLPGSGQHPPGFLDNSVNINLTGNRDRRAKLQRPGDRLHPGESWIASAWSPHPCNRTAYCPSSVSDDTEILKPSGAGVPGADRQRGRSALMESLRAGVSSGAVDTARRTQRPRRVSGGVVGLKTSARSRRRELTWLHPIATRRATTRNRSAGSVVSFPSFRTGKRKPVRAIVFRRHPARR